MGNPFTLRVLPPGAPFCDRDRELIELESHARNTANVVLFSARRYGKTSLVRRLQAHLAESDMIPFYTDFFMVTSPGDVAERIAKSVYTILHRRESLLKKGIRYLKTFKTFRPVFKPSAREGLVLTVEPSAPGLSGTEMLEQVLDELGNFMHRESAGIHMVIDEFQEITELRKHPVEGLLRQHIQAHPASYFFVGSRRRVLLDMFHQKKRPFYQSAIMYPLGPLPKDDLLAFLTAQFEKGGIHCTVKQAESLYEKTEGYPYYVQALSYFVFEESRQNVTSQSIDIGFQKMLASERYGYEAIVQSLSGVQVSLLRALAVDPRKELLSADYMTRHRLSVGGIQSARKKLLDLDLIEKTDTIWKVVDPVFASWLADYG